MKTLELRKRSRGMNAQGLYDVQQGLIHRTFGHSLGEMMDKDMMMEVPNGESNIKPDVAQSWKIAEMNEQVKQTLMTTATGTQAFMLNDAAAGYFGASTGVFNPAVYAQILEGNAIQSLIPKLWGVQPFANNDLSTKLVYFVKPDPFTGSAGSKTPTFARAAEGRAGADIGFEVKAENVDAQRYIVHLPYSMELQKVLQGRLGLDAKVMEAFTEAATYRDEYWSFHKWYLALTAGTLEGQAQALYTDGVLADVDGVPEAYTAYYNLTTGAIKCGDSGAYGAATANTASGADIFDLILFVIETMGGAVPGTSLGHRGYRMQWVPDYVVVPQKVANKLIRDYKDGTLTTVWVAKQDIPMYKDESNFLCRLQLGNKGIDVWVAPNEVFNQLPTATYVTTDSPTVSISPMFFGTYMGMAAVAPASPLLFFVDDGYEVVGSNPGTLRRNMTKVHTMFQLKSEMLLNASRSFVVKVVEVAP